MQPLQGCRKVYCLFIFYNYATSTKLKQYPRRGYIIVEYLITIVDTTSERLHNKFTGQ
jgi:hypothetical protein